MNQVSAHRRSVRGDDGDTIGRDGLPGRHPSHRVEDQPVMTRETVGFSLLHDGFFDQNAALDAP
jgi:Cu2+-containing amine oxidase